MSERHLYIAGPGRAGTSLLVRYLTALGLETELSRAPDPNHNWDSDANAGLESAPTRLTSPDLPYVVKSPWMFAVIDQLLAKGFPADAVIIPIRDLSSAAVSRAVLEYRKFHEVERWAAELEAPWELRGYVPGGNLHSMHPIDQMRNIAVGFYHLIERLVGAQIPFSFLHFPRFAEDPDYLYMSLARIIPGISLRKAQEAFAQCMDPAKIRVRAKTTETTDPTLLQMENQALKREIAKLRGGR